MTEFEFRKLKQIDLSKLPLDESGAQFQKAAIYEALDSMGPWSMSIKQQWQEPYHYHDQQSNSFQLYGYSYYISVELTLGSLKRSGVGVVTRAYGHPSVPLAYQDAEFVALMQALQKFSIGTRAHEVAAPERNEDTAPSISYQTMTDEELEDNLPFNSTSAQEAPTVMGEAVSNPGAKVVDYVAEEAPVNEAIETFVSEDGKDAWGNEASLYELERLKENRERLKLYTEQLLVPLVRDFLKNESATVVDITIANVKEFNDYIEATYTTA